MTQRLDEYVKEKLGSPKDFTEKKVRNKIDWMQKNRKHLYSVYQKKGETGKEVDGEHEINLDLEAAERA